jgi:hypothetical protein
LMSAWLRTRLRPPLLRLSVKVAGLLLCHFTHKSMFAMKIQGNRRRYARVGLRLRGWRCLARGRPASRRAWQCDWRRHRSRGVGHRKGASPSVAQQISPRPVSVESAPYFPALVASSWIASPMACAEAGFRRSPGPSTLMREPMRSAKSASWARTKSSTSTPCHSLRISRSWPAASVRMRSAKHPIKSSGSRVAVWRAIARTRLSMFLAR